MIKKISKYNLKAGKGLKAIREIKYPELSQKEFADKIEVSQTWMSLLEKDHKQPSDKIVADICDEVGINPLVIFLFGLDETDFPKDKRKAFNKHEYELKEILKELI